LEFKLGFQVVECKKIIIVLFFKWRLDEW
jgi:hypothetical protein